MQFSGYMRLYFCQLWRWSLVVATSFDDETIYQLSATNHSYQVHHIIYDCAVHGEAAVVSYFGTTRLLAMHHVLLYILNEIFSIVTTR